MFIIQIKNRYGFDTVIAAHDAADLLKKLLLNEQEFKNEFDIPLEKLQSYAVYKSVDGNTRICKMYGTESEWEL